MNLAIETENRRQESELRQKDKDATDSVELVEIEELGKGIFQITLNRPNKGNALSIQLRNEMTLLLKKLVADDKVKVLIISGKGNSFCTGFDLKEFLNLAKPDLADTLWQSSDQYHEAVLNFPFPVIASINGAALGGGFDLAVMCDLRIASDNVEFAHPEIVMGEVVYSPLHELVGGALARDLCLTGRKVKGEEALAINLISQKVALEDLDKETLKLAKRIARAPRDVLKRMKQKIVKRADIPFVSTLDL